MSSALISLCRSHGIEPTYVDMTGSERTVPDETLGALAQAFGLTTPAPAPASGIAEALAESDPPQCHIPPQLRDARLWGVTCQLGSLASGRNLGVGDFADLAVLCRLVAAEGGDFVGVNPLHALFWSDPGRASPFFPSNRRFLNPLYLALDWIDDPRLKAADSQLASRLRGSSLVDMAAVGAFKDRLLRQLFAERPRDAAGKRRFEEFCAAGGEALAAHALFEAISERMASEQRGVGWMSWPDGFRHRQSPEVRAFAAANRDRIDYHLWLQWLADEQLGRVASEARAAGMRIGLYLDCAVGAAPDGSATWTDADLTVPSLSIGSPPDAFSALGQDWGLAPISPRRLAETGCAAFAETIRSVLGHAGATRIDHAMGLARLWLIPRGMPSQTGAYVRYPLAQLLHVVAEESQRAGAIVIGEDLGTVPVGFRELLAQRRIHSSKVLLFERGPQDFHDPRGWPVDAFACIATHDMPTFLGWWSGADLELGWELGRIQAEAWPAALRTRDEERAALLRLVGRCEEPGELSRRLHARLAESPCRLVALQMEDALDTTRQVNVPGTTTDYPNWRHRLPVALEALAHDESFRTHAAGLRSARPR